MRPQTQHDGERNATRGPVRVRLRVKEPLIHSRLFHANVFSTALHVIVYLIFAFDLVRHPVKIRPQPLFAGTPMQIALIPLESLPEPVAVATAPESVESAPSETSLPAPRATPKPPAESAREPKPATESETTIETPVAEETEPVEESPESAEIPQSVVSTATVAELMSPQTESLPKAQPMNEATLAPQPLKAPTPAPVGSGEPTTNDGDESNLGEPAALEQPDAQPISAMERRAAQIGQALRAIARAASGGAENKAVDIVFLLDLSGSMKDNILAVGENLTAMADEFHRRDADATFGVVKFKVATFVVFPQSDDIDRYRRLLANTKVGGDEEALTALYRSMRKVKFRDSAQRRFILVTDEPFEGKPSLPELLTDLMRHRIIVDVIGLNIPEHRLLARSTGGTWRLIPGAK